MSFFSHYIPANFSITILPCSPISSPVYTFCFVYLFNQRPTSSILIYSFYIVPHFFFPLTFLINFISSSILQDILDCEILYLKAGIYIYCYWQMVLLLFFLFLDNRNKLVFRNTLLNDVMCFLYYFAICSESDQLQWWLYRLHWVWIYQKQTYGYRLCIKKNCRGPKMDSCGTLALLSITLQLWFSTMLSVGIQKVYELYISLSNNIIW